MDVRPLLSLLVSPSVVAMIARWRSRIAGLLLARAVTVCAVFCTTTAAHAACAAADWQSSQIGRRDTLRIPSNCVPGMGYAVAYPRRTPTQQMRSQTPAAALRQLACCKTLANQASVAQLALSGATGALEATLVLQELCKDSDFGLEHREARAALPDPDLERQAKTHLRRRPGIPSSTSSNASVDAWDDAAAPIRHEGTTAPRKAPVAGQVFQ